MVREADTEARGETAPRQWSRTADTQRHILAAAEEVFIELGYSKATVSDVIERADSSVGSIYHHFGGKAELYMALWRTHVSELERAAARAVAQARTDESLTPYDLYEIGGIAYLDGIWKARRAFAIFYNGDSPPGFELELRQRAAEWMNRNARILNLGKKHEDRFMSRVFTAIIGEASRSIIECTRASQAKEVTRRAVEVTRRIAMGD